MDGTPPHVVRGWGTAPRGAWMEHRLMHDPLLMQVQIQRMHVHICMLAKHHDDHLDSGDDLPRKHKCF
jgi:hypothetical protein